MKPTDYKSRLGCFEYFVTLASRLESENVPQKQLKETAIAEVQKLMTLVQHTTVSTTFLLKYIF
jgi:hypothetical protein